MITMLKGLKVTKALLNLRGPGEGGFKILSKSTKLFLIDGSNIYQMLLVPLFLAEIIAGQRSAVMCDCIARAILNRAS